MKHLKKFNENLLDSNTVYVVTDTEAGWDCVVGVYSKLEFAVAECGGEYIPDKAYYSYEFDTRIIHEQEVI